MVWNFLFIMTCSISAGCEEFFWVGEGLSCFFFFMLSWYGLCCSRVINQPIAFMHIWVLLSSMSRFPRFAFFSWSFFILFFMLEIFGLILKETDRENGRRKKTWCGWVEADGKKICHLNVHYFFNKKNIIDGRSLQTANQIPIELF